MFKNDPLGGTAPAPAGPVALSRRNLFKLGGLAAASVGSLIDPFTPRRLALVAGGAVFVALILSWTAITGIERKSTRGFRVQAGLADDIEFQQAA